MSYLIKVKRTDLMSGNGTISLFHQNKEVFNSHCFEHAGARIPARTYVNCSKTTMSERGWPAIYIPDDQTNRKGIFIHKGDSQSWSEGCICVPVSEIDNLLNLLPSKVGAITVEVIN